MMIIDYYIVIIMKCNTEKCLEGVFLFKMLFSFHHIVDPVTLYCEYNGLELIPRLIPRYLFKHLLLEFGVNVKCGDE